MYCDIYCPNEETAHYITLSLDLPDIDTTKTNHFSKTGSIEATSKALDILHLSDKNLRYLIQDKAHRVYINKKLQKKETICARKCISL